MASGETGERRAGTAPARVRVGFAPVDCLSPDEAVERICELATSTVWSQMVVTPNIHHVVALEGDAAFREAYDRAALCLPDGWPVVLAARLLGARGQRRVTGADLLPAVCEAAAGLGLSVGFLGGQPDAAERCAARFQEHFPKLRVQFVHPAPVGFDESPQVRSEILARLAERRPDILFVGLGAPRQEIFVHRRNPMAHVVLCVGAALDFSAGLRRRAPRAFQRLGLEWLFRILVEPRRLWRRYATALVPFLRIVSRQWRTRRR